MTKDIKFQTLIKVCQSWVFAPPKSPCFVNILFMFEAKLVWNLIFCITFLLHRSLALLITMEDCLVVHHYKSESNVGMPCLPQCHLAICLCYSSHLKFSISIMWHSFQYALSQTNEILVGAHRRETNWIGWSIISYLNEIPPSRPLGNINGNKFLDELMNLTLYFLILKKGVSLYGTIT